MVNFSRRQLARYAVDQLLNKKSPADISRHLAAALIESKKQNEADLLMSDIAEQLENQGLLAQATVISATNLSASLKKQLAAQVKKATQVDEVILSEHIEPNVIGGFRVETATRTWDKTLQRKLAEIKGGI